MVAVVLPLRYLSKPSVRRSESFEKYRKGNTTATSYPESDKAKLSDTGK